MVMAGSLLKWLACGIFGAGMISAANGATAQEDVLVPATEPTEYRVERLDPRWSHRGDAVYFVVDEAPAAEGAKTAQADKNEYWLGVRIAELTDVVKQQLGIDQGLVVEDVMPDSPAAKADIKKNDILIK